MYFKAHVPLRFHGILKISILGLRQIIQIDILAEKYKEIPGHLRRIKKINFFTVKT